MVDAVQQVLGGAVVIALVLLVVVELDRWSPPRGDQDDFDRREDSW